MLKLTVNELAEKLNKRIYHANSVYAIHWLEDVGGIKEIACGTALDWFRKEKAKATTVNQVTCVKCVKWLLGMGIEVEGYRLHITAFKS